MRITRSATIVLPLVALLAATVSAIVLAAQAGLSFCGNRVAVPMPADAMASMPGMNMTGGAQIQAGSHAMMICPVVLVLIVASALLALGAIALLWRDPNRRLARHTIVNELARLPLGRTAGGLLLAGSAAVALMLALDGAGPPALPACALLAALLVACSLSAALLSIFAGRVALAFGRRLMLAIVAAISAVTDAAEPCIPRLVPVVAGGHAVPLLAAGRGLRAPPLFVR